MSGEGGAALRVGSVVIDCNDFATMLAFWAAALGYVPREEPQEGWAVLRDPGDANVRIALQKVPEPRIGKNRLHLDLYTSDIDGEIERLLSLGARRYQREPEPGEDFVTLEDPEHNLFDVIDERGQSDG
ncbi:MAG TPA: VOC family protein [Actinomycetota bacterium]|nr:VOC family protein [Actinomycetota bacterium]